jgi:hypothetical protein
MSRKSNNMTGEGLVSPMVVSAEFGNQEMLKQSHIKVDDRIFAVDPNLDFDSSIIMAQDRAYSCDNIQDITQPLTWTIQPQYNVFRSLSESRFVFRLQLQLLALPGGTFDNLHYSLKPYFSALFVNDIVINVNNVNCADQHSRTAQYSHFIKTILLQANLKPVNSNVTWQLRNNTVNFCQIAIQSFSSDDHRTLSEGIVNIDGCTGLDSLSGSHNVSMFMQNGLLNQIGVQGASNGVIINPLYGTGIVNMTYNSTNAAFEITYIPRDGIFNQPKFMPPGINLNYVLTMQPFSKWLNGWDAHVSGGFLQAQAITQGGLTALVPEATGPGSFLYVEGVTILSATYYERQYSITQTALRAYQALIVRQPLYYSCMTSNTLLFPVNSLNVQLTNLFAGRIPNIITVCLLNQSQSNSTLNVNQLLTYAPSPGITESPLYQTNTTAPRVLPTVACIGSVNLTVNGRRYPNLWTANQVANSTANVQQWYEQYKQCSLISRASGRGDNASNSNLDLTYKFDSPILTLSEFKSVFNVLCFNIRRNGTVMNCSGDREVGGVDMILQISSDTGLVPPNAQLMLCGINTDSICSITDGGSSCSFVF